MKCDLHTHSSASDGVLSPQAVLARAIQNGVDCLALTDHDTMEGYKQLQQAISRREIDWAGELVAGVELTVSHASQIYHVLALWVDAKTPALIALLEQQAGVRDIRAEKIDQRLQKCGIQGALAGAKAQAAGAVLSRPHFARFLVEAGYCAKESQAYKRWLGKGKVADVPCEWPAMGEVIDVIHQAGGLAVLAHPNKYGLTRTIIDKLMADFKALSGDAIELISGKQEQSITDSLGRLAKKHGLACSLGSDFHSPDQVWADIGCIDSLPIDIQPVWQLRKAC